MMERRNKRKDLACKCNIEVSFLVYVFLILSWISVWVQNAKGFVYFQHVKVAFILSRPFSVAGARSRRRRERRDVFARRFLSAFSRLTPRLALAKKHTHEECKECHEVNVMASQ